MSRNTETESRIHVKDYRECIRDACQGLQKGYHGYMLKITESVLVMHVKEYRKCIGIHVKDYQEFIRDTC